MKFALNITTPEVERALPVALLEGPFEQKIKSAASLGFDGVELVPARPETLDAAGIRAQVEGLGLEVAAVSSGAQASLEKMTLLADSAEGQQKAFARLEALVTFAAGVGAPIVTIGSFRGRVTGEGGDNARSRLVEVLRRGARMAAAQNIRLVVEPLNRYETELIFNVGEGLALVEETGESHLGLLLDTFHANIEEPSIKQSIRAALGAGRLWHVHIADSNRQPPGQGHIDFPGIFRVLEEAGYAGTCSAELLSKPDPLTAAARTIHYCRSHSPS